MKRPARTLAVVSIGATLSTASLSVGGCGERYVRDPVSSCQLLQANRGNIDRTSGSDLVFLSRDTPAIGDALNAYRQRITIPVLGGIGAGALVAGFVNGFATDPVTNPAARTSAYVLGGGAMGLFAVALLLAYTSRAPAERARHTLHWWADRCQQ